MVELFSDIPEAIENTVEIAKAVTLPYGSTSTSAISNHGMTTEDFWKVSEEGLEERLEFLFPDEEVCKGRFPVVTPLL